MGGHSVLIDGVYTRSQADRHYRVDDGQEVRPQWVPFTVVITSHGQGEWITHGSRRHQHPVPQSRENNADRQPETVTGARFYDERPGQRRLKAPGSRL